MSETYTVRYEWDERGIKKAVRIQDFRMPLLREDPATLLRSVRDLASKIDCREIRECIGDWRINHQLAFIWRRPEDKETAAPQGRWE